jgi:hypothetical protein
MRARIKQIKRRLLTFPRHLGVVYYMLKNKEAFRGVIRKKWAHPAIS